MLIKAPKRKHLSSIQSTEEHAPLLLPVRRLAHCRWYPLYKAAQIVGLDESRLLYVIIKSKFLHAVQAADGQVFVHPDGLIRYARNLGKKIAISFARRIYRTHLQGREYQS